MLSHMANPYTQPYEKYRGMGRVAGPSAQERQQNQQASGTGDILRMLAGAAPTIGSGLGMAAGLALPALGGIIGGPAGAALGSLTAPAAAELGGKIGGMFGQTAGGLAGAGANMAERPGLERQQERDRQIEMLLQAFGSRR
jgi:hypothetical protein